MSDPKQILNDSADKSQAKVGYQHDGLRVLARIIAGKLIALRVIPKKQTECNRDGDDREQDEAPFL